MLTDRQNRPFLIFSLAAYAFLMALMALAAAALPALGVFGALLAFAIWPLLLSVIVGSMAWIGDAPVVRALMARRTWHHEIAAGLLFLLGIVVTVAAVFAGWFQVSFASYAGLCAVTGAAAAHQYVLLKREDRWIAGTRIASHARLVS